MEFFTVNGKRPVRLCEATRRFAYESLYEHKYGLDTKKDPAVCFDGLPGYEKMSLLDIYDEGIYQIVRRCRIRICDGEKISGAATYGLAIQHRVPIMRDGTHIIRSVSHLTVDFEKVLKKGINGIKAEIAESRKHHSGKSELRFLDSCDNVVECFEYWKERYINELTEKGYTVNAENLKKVPDAPAGSFYEAVQSLWFVFAFLRLCGNWPGIGRIDVLLGDYLRHDLENGVLTLDGAREILAHFFIKGCEWVSGDNCTSGDAQHYQNIVLAGTGSDGKQVENEVTYLVLDIVEELGISDFPITVRLNSETSEKLLTRIAEVMKLGGGVLAVYNEELIRKSLERYGYPADEAVNFANDGCWEVQIPGKTYFRYIPIDSLAVLQNVTLKKYSQDVTFASFEELLSAFNSDIRKEVADIRRTVSAELEFADGKYTFKPFLPCTAVSLFEDCCIERALSYWEGGCKYNVVSPHIGGFPDAVNSLYAIKKLVFDDKKIGFSEFMRILADNWENNEPLRLYALNGFEYYGNDNDEVDAIAVSVLTAFEESCKAADRDSAFRFPAGVSTFGRQLEWIPNRLAAPYGRRRGDVLAANCSPTPGTDRESATATVRSYCKLPLIDAVTGAALDLHLLPSSVNGKDGTDALVGLMRGFVKLGGFFMQPDVESTEVLRRAQEHPEDYRGLSVRVSGWNARFVTLSREWQDMVINDRQ